MVNYLFMPVHIPGLVAYIMTTSDTECVFTQAEVKDTNVSA